MLTYCLPDPPKTSVYSYHIAHNLVVHLPSSHDGNRTAVCIPHSELVPWQSRSTGYSALFQNHRILTVPCRWVATRSIVVAYNRCPLCFSYMVHNTVCERFVVWWTRRTTCNFSYSHRRSFSCFLLWLSKHVRLPKCLLQYVHEIRTPASTHGGLAIQSLHVWAEVCVASRRHPLTQAYYTNRLALATVSLAITWRWRTTSSE